MRYLCYYQYLLYIVLFSVYGCNNSSEENRVENPFEGVPEIKVGEPMDITDGSLSEITDFHFSTVWFHQIAINNNGHMFVSNRGGENRIYHFNENGDFVGYIGGGGQGPGEFQSWPAFDVTDSDTIYSLDRSTSVVNRFEFENGGWNYKDGFVLGQKENYQVSKIFLIDDERLAISYEPTHLSRRSSMGLNVIVDLISVTGETLKENWFNTPDEEYFIYISESGNMSIGRPLPFGTRSIVDIGYQNRLYHTWTGEFLIQILHPDSIVPDSIRHVSFYQDLSEDQRISAADVSTGARTSNNSDMLAMGEQLFEEIPYATPAVQDIHVDRDTGYIIVRRYSFDNNPNWLLMDETGKRMGVFTLDEDMTVFDFRKGKIIGSLTTEDSIPTIRVVEIPELVI